MAGIGFRRLKRLLAEDTYSGWLRAHLYGAVVSAGPWLLSVCTLAVLAFLSESLVETREQALFRAIVVYTYTFSLVTTGAIQMVVTRHLADCLYVGRVGAVLSTFRWSLGATALAHLALAAGFYGWAPDLDVRVRLLGIVLFVAVANTWVVMIFVGALQDYASVGLAFLVGNVLSLGGALGLGARRPRRLVGGFVLGQSRVFMRALRSSASSPCTAPPESRLSARSVATDLALAASVHRRHHVPSALWLSPIHTGFGSWFYCSLYDSPSSCYLSVAPSRPSFSQRGDRFLRSLPRILRVVSHGSWTCCRP